MRKSEKLGVSDVYQYDVTPLAFRIQVVHIWNDALGDFSKLSNERSYLWITMYKKIVREFSVMDLIDFRVNS